MIILMDTKGDKMNGLISELVGDGIGKGLIEEADKIFVINRLLELFKNWKGNKLMPD